MGTLRLNKSNSNKVAVEEVKQSAEQINVTNAEEEVCAIAKQDEGFVDEFKNLRTANETVYKRNDRTCRKVITAKPMRYRAEDGEFKEISTRLIDDGAKIVNEANEFKLTFDKDAHSGKIFDLQRGDKTVTLSAAGSAKARDHVCGCKCELCAGADDTVTATLDDGTEIQYVSLSDRVKENIIIKEKRDSYEYFFKLAIGDMSVEEGEHNELLLKDKDSNETQFVIPAPYMYDANKTRSDKVSYEIDVNGGELLIKVVADADFINADDRAFPVTIDPQIVLPFGEILTYGTRDINNENNYVKGEMVVDSQNSKSTFITVHKNKISTTGVIEKVILSITVKNGGVGYFGIRNHLGVYQLVAKQYNLDITNDYKNSEDQLEIELFADTISYNNEKSFGEFFTDGVNAAKIIITYSVDETHMIKHFDIADRATVHVNLNTCDTVTEMCDLVIDKTLPLKISHIHKVGTESTSFGLNWRSNLNKKLKIATADTTDNTFYIFSDEFGDNYTLEEKYYYINNGAKFFVEKSKITANINGELFYGTAPIYTCQSNNGYTLVSEINDFKNSELIEQRQEKQAQLEDYLMQTKPSLLSYVKIKKDNKDEIELEKDDFTKAKFDSFIEGVDEKSDYILVPKSQLPRDDKGNRVEFDNDAFSQAQDNFPLIKKAFLNYFAKEAELEVLIKQIPVNYIKDESGIINGFNKNGDLVLIGDGYGNYYAINYDENNRITYIYDDSGVVARFNYAGGYLMTITDYRGRTVKFNYDGNKLVGLAYSDGTIYDITYSFSKINSITTGDGVRTDFSYLTGNSIYVGALTKLLTLITSPSVEILSEIKLAYSRPDGVNTVEITDTDGHRQRYGFNSTYTLVSYTEADRYTTIKICNITTEKNSSGKTVTEKTRTFKPDLKDTIETKQYNNMDLLISKTVDWHRISDTVQVKTETRYGYDKYNNIIRETVINSTNKSYSVSANTTVTNYSYNLQGRLALTEKYVEGEELTSGKFYKQNVYDDNGNVTKTISWNSLDSSSKFYEECDRAENGQVIADRNEAGEVSAEYEYEAGSNTVKCVKMPNGVKFAYGRDPLSDRVTAITQSTEDGEANSTDIVYENGLPVKVTSGNTVIEYTYDHKGRKKAVNINGVPHSEYSYEDYKLLLSDNARYFKQSCTLKVDGKDIKSVLSKDGSCDGEVIRFDAHESYKIGSEVQYKKDYDDKGNLTDVTYKNDGECKVHYTYDKYRRLTEAKTTLDDAVTTENYAYNDYGDLSEKSYTGAVTHTYSYAYKDNAARSLDYITFGDYKFKPLTDVNGRNIGKEIFNSENKLAAEYITYRKVGDHATNMPATVWFANGTKIEDSIKYKYDSCGNICEIRENGHLVAKYTYDSLNRLVREDNKAIGKTYLFAYDRSGNVTERCEYDYTLKSGEDLAERDCAHFSFDYEGDRLVSYNGEACAYNSIGNPTKYRNKVVEWQYGTRLAKLGDVIFEYDGLGRRTKKNDLVFIYDNDGRLIAQGLFYNTIPNMPDLGGWDTVNLGTGSGSGSNLIIGLDTSENMKTNADIKTTVTFSGLQFVYDHAGVTGIRVDDRQYFYRKDAQGNIIAILDSNGKVVVKYVYDAWGNHAVLDANGNNITDAEHIGNLNPFRYRGYYYDVETGLYYLQTRYYDPELGRFISQDNIDYADPEKINGLNLYAYCLNNPVMNVDPTGEFFFSFLFAVIAGALIGGIIGGISALNNGDSFGTAFWGGFVNGAISAIGLAAGLAIASLGGVPALIAGGIVAALGGFAGGFLGNMTAQHLAYGDVDYNIASIAGAIGAGNNIMLYTAINMNGATEIGKSLIDAFINNIKPSSIPIYISLALGFAVPMFNPNNLRGRP